MRDNLKTILHGLFDSINNIFHAHARPRSSPDHMRHHRLTEIHSGRREPQHPPPSFVPTIPRQCSPRPSEPLSHLSNRPCSPEVQASELQQHSKWWPPSLRRLTSDSPSTRSRKNTALAYLGFLKASAACIRTKLLHAHAKRATLSLPPHPSGWSVMSSSGQCLEHICRHLGPIRSG